tara:strand:+ start:476 stop:1501 length:1026 start_codon:yes stop_codon:yes gene_type:complete
MQKKIVVTGGLGFIGSNLVRFLIAKGFFVINIDKVSYSSNFYNLLSVNKKKYKFYKSNIGNQNLIKKILLRHRPIGIFNLAAETHVDRSIDSPKKFIENNICDVFNLLESVKIYLKKIKNKKFRFIHISTDEVYGDIKKKAKSKESDPYLPSSPYAASKAASDLLIKSYIRTYGFPAIITNSCNNYGPRQYPEKLIPRIIINYINNINLPVYGNGQNEREWIHVNDHCSALLKIFEKGKLGENYNIGSGNIVKNINLIKKIIFYIKKLLQSDSQIEFVQDRPGHDKRYALDSKKIKTKLGWRKKYNFSIGIEDTIKWYLSNETWIKKIINKKYLKRIGLKK